VGDGLRKVHTGEKLRLSAEAYNSFVDAAIAHKRQQNLKNNRLENLGPNMVVVQNDTGGVVSRYDVLGITGVVYTLGTSCEQIVLTVGSPTTKGKFVIAAQPMAVDALGIAYCSGVCQARLNIASEAMGYKLCDIASGQSYLEPCWDGSAAILYQPTGTGLKWCVIRFSKPPGGSEIMRAKATAAAAASTTIAAVLLTPGGGDGTAISVTNLNGGDWDDLFPLLAINDVFAVVQINNVWYGIGFAYVGACA